MKPSPSNIQELYLESSENWGSILWNTITAPAEDNWENPSTGSAGLGWEVADGMEITQFTYFQQVGGLATGPGNLRSLRIRTFGFLHPRSRFVYDIEAPGVNTEIFLQPEYEH